jgi:hypothetical protein
VADPGGDRAFDDDDDEPCAPTTALPVFLQR